MHSHLCGVWSVVMTLSVFFFLFPNVALCHLGSALRVGTGEGKPPVLSHVRVSREPQPRIIYNGDFVDSESLPQTSKIKSPSYQHKILQFHSGGQTSSLPNHYPTKLLVNQYPASKSLPVYPVASKYGKVDVRKLIGNPSTDTDDDEDDDGSWEAFSSKWDPHLLPEPDEPTFTPYIGARALNIPKFFQHLRENIEALYENGRDSPSSQDEALAMEYGKGEVDSDKSSETGDVVADIERIATPTRRGYSSNSNPSRIVADEDNMTSRDSRSFNFGKEQGYYIKYISFNFSLLD
ncbi:unnamed protein product [Orchesella dallaii]|uniref:Uncharacterized protein n=1 Tax=Orchesella dallaii TaxID=48710 RepID=A0ABP1Q9J0_9HEXA